MRNILKSHIFKHSKVDMDPESEDVNTHSVH
jgi:hypothetical protein